MIDFRALAKEKAGARWSSLDETQRRAAIRRAKVAWLERRLGGEVKRETYAEWLAAQPAAVQDTALGATRGRLFREGKLAIDRFTDPVGRPYTLAQLAATRPETFIRAGLDPDDFNEE